MEAEGGPPSRLPRKGFWRLPVFLSFVLDPRALLTTLATAALYLLLSVTNARIDRTILLTTRFSDAQASLQKIDDLLLLNTTPLETSRPFRGPSAETA